MNIRWSVGGNEYYPREASHQLDKLPLGVYSVRENPMSGEIFLARTQEQFKFDYKLYDIETDFVKRVKVTWDNTNGHLGVLLNGLKGTGKTVTAELICNEVNLPVLLIERAFKGLSHFLDNVQQNVVVFFDEFEKSHGGGNLEEDEDGTSHGGNILSLMDGTSNKEHRRLFLLTTNKPRVNQNMLERPGRLRYIKNFGDLSLASIVEIVDDLLIHPELKRTTVQFIAQLNLITVDIVKAVINEVNIHKEAPKDFEGIFNVTKKMPKYDVYWPDRNDGKEPTVPYEYYVELYPQFLLQPETDPDYFLGDHLRFDGRSVGVIQKVDGKEVTIEVPLPSKDGNRRTETRTYRLEQKENYHENFRDYAF